MRYFHLIIILINFIHGIIAVFMSQKEFIMSHRLSILSQCLLLSLISPCVAYADVLEANALENEPHANLGELTVTATRSLMPVDDAPASVTIINSRQIEKNPALNLSDVLKYDPSIFNRSQWGGIGQPSSLSLRGTNATHTLVLKDGARLNSQNGTSPLYPAFLDLTDVERIEILKGPASVQYGSDAIGGVVQMISKAPAQTGVALTGLYGENDTYKAIVSGDLVADNGLYATISGQRLESDGTRIFNTQSRDNKAGYEQKGYTAKLGFDNQQLNTFISINQNEGVNEYSDDGGISNTAQRQFDNQIITAKATYDINDNLTIDARHSIVDDSQIIVGQYPANYDTKNKDSDINVRWRFAPNQNVLFGVGHVSSEYESNNLTDNQQQNKSTGYYAQHQYNSDKINTQVGVRLEDNDRFGNHTVAQGAIRYHFTPATSVYANIGSAFRAPTLDEMYSTFYLPNPDLKPEESLSYEVGINHNFNQNLALALSAYRTDVDNLIRTTCLTNPGNTYCWGNTQNTNIDKASFTGGELGLKWRQGNYYTSLQYAYVKTEDESDNSANRGNELSYRPQHNGVLTFGYDDGIVGVSTSLVAHSKSYANAANTVKVPGYATVDVNAHWNINSNIKLFSNIQNIGDVEYKSSNYSGNQWYVNGGRQANLGVTFKY